MVGLGAVMPTMVTGALMAIFSTLKLLLMSRGLHHHAERRETGNFRGKGRNSVGPTESWYQSLARFHDWHTVCPLYTENGGKTKVTGQAKAMNLETAFMVCIALVLYTNHIWPVFTRYAVSLRLHKN